MIFTGTDALNPQATALALVEGALTEALATEPHATTFYKWYGVIVTHDNQLAHDNVAKSKRPMLFLEVVSDEVFDFKHVIDNELMTGARHELQISIEIVTCESCRPAEEPLKNVLTTIVNQAYARLRDAGLEGSTIKAGRAANDTVQRVNPHLLKGTLYTLDIA